MSKIRAVNRPIIWADQVGNGLVLEISTDFGCFFVPHDALVDWVGENKNALDTHSWKVDRCYHWPSTSADMRKFLEDYRREL